MNWNEAVLVRDHWEEKLTKKYSDRFREPYNFFDVFIVGNEDDYTVRIFEDFTRSRKIKVAPKYAREKS